MILHKSRTKACHIIKRYCAGNRREKAKNEYSATFLFPKTDFPPVPENVAERDKYISTKAKFLHYYEWQRNHIKGKEFVLHDGPPYANGVPHMGHAINKVFKDIILRSQLIQGSKVHFVPGWDCHGLPTELIALKDVKKSLSPIDIREESRKTAFSNMEYQKESFKAWGVLGNWDKAYNTSSSEYVIHELQLFWKLYEKGLVFHGLKPIYWSPSSRTALAEAELCYNHEHVSPAATVRLAIENESHAEPMYLLIWTTTPWTLPFNKAVYLSKELDYSVVKISSLPGSYILATNLIELNQKKLNKEITIVRNISASEVKNFKYRHPWYKNNIMNIYEDDNVKEVATGLLHCAPAHGHNDFLLALRDGLPVDCFVDESGCFANNVDPILNGAHVLNEGSDLVINTLGDDVILKETYVHAYPYDWRTNEPVIVLSSKQWFIDTEKLKNKAVECLSDVSVPTGNLSASVASRPYWCLSRQRVWGTPIPVFFEKQTGRILLSQNTVDHVCKLIEKLGPDSWWSAETKDLFPERFCEEFGVKIEDVEKGHDIMDIWFDSGISWSFVLGGKIADVCVEGPDQFRGWFQSSLLTSVALRGKAPYKKLIVHGFAVDEDGKKMSKSIGNVFDPKTVTEGKDALGADILRWWVALHSRSVHAPISQRLLKKAKQDVHRVRLIIKFALGSLSDCHIGDIINIPHLSHIDRYCLNACYDRYYSVIDDYNNYDFASVVSQILHFTSNTVSSWYINSIKDVLYCDGIDSERRKSSIYTLNGILDTLTHCIAPILPHLAEEIYLYHPFYKGKSFFYNEQMWKPPSEWKNESSTDIINLGMNIRSHILSITPKSREFSCIIQAEEKDYNLLKKLQDGKDESLDSELTALLQVAHVELKKGDYKVTLREAEKSKCPRCRRFTAPKDELCNRCKNLLTKYENQSKAEV